MADGLYYVDSRQPFLSANVPQVTLGTTDKALIPVANMPVLGSNYFSMVGKAVRIRCSVNCLVAPHRATALSVCIRARAQMRSERFWWRQRLWF